MGAAKSAPAPAKSEANPEMKKAVMDKATAGLGGAKKSGPRSTHIDHHTNGSHTVKVQMRNSDTNKIGNPEDSEQSYAVANSSDLISRLKEMLGVSDGGDKKPAAAAPVSSAAPAPAAAEPSMP